MKTLRLMYAASAMLILTAFHADCQPDGSLKFIVDGGLGDIHAFQVGHGRVGGAPPYIRCGSAA